MTIYAGNSQNKTKPRRSAPSRGGTQRLPEELRGRVAPVSDAVFCGDRAALWTRRSGRPDGASDDWVGGGTRLWRPGHQHHPDRPDERRLRSGPRADRINGAGLEDYSLGLVVWADDRSHAARCAFRDL